MDTFRVCLKYTWSRVNVTCTSTEILRVSPVETSLFAEHLPTPCPPLLRRVIEDLNSYFQGKVIDFADIPVCLEHGSVFQQKVWQAIKRIPYGKVRTYQWIANRIGQPHAVRAVGNATGANPAALLIPCHRVIRSNGGLGGYSGGGIERKQALLALENSI